MALSKPTMKDVYITIFPKEDESLSSMVDRLAHSIQAHNAEVVKFDVYGSRNKFSECLSCLEGAFSKIDWPINWIEGGEYSAKAVEGMQIQAVSGVPVDTIYHDAKPIGRVFENDLAKYCIIGNILSNKHTASKKEQTRHTFEKLEKALELAGMEISNVARTWLYIDDIFHFYDEFNKIRTKFYKEKGILDGFIPASTGIGGKNLNNTGLLASALAIQVKNSDMTIQEVLSPLQCPARKYGSSFSRAVEINTPEQRSVLVSGTASIEESGETVHIGDVDKQVAFTMEVVEAILISRGLSFTDVTRAVVYFKNDEDTIAFENYCKNNRKLALPALITNNDMCRENLLFEIEVDAVSRK